MVLLLGTSGVGWAIMPDAPVRTEQPEITNAAIADCLHGRVTH